MVTGHRGRSLTVAARIGAARIGADWIGGANRIGAAWSSG